MNLIKKCVSFILAVMLVPLSAAACGKEKTSDSAGISNDPEPSQDVSVRLEAVIPDNINPLTGLEASYDVSGKRPISVMLNNIYQALPQVGIASADVLFECLAEGGITRLMGVFSEYDNLGVVGSVRSSRPYYLDFAQMFDAIYCHAGGSEDAYSQMSSRGINHIDGVRGDPLGVYYRDEERLKTKALEHTLMTTGEGIIRTIEYYGFRTDLRDGFEYPWEFPEYTKTADIGKNESTHIYLPISNYQTVDYEYDPAAKVYKRFQYNGEAHIDGETDEQLAFTNVIVLFCNTAVYDSYGRLQVDTVGEGSGYLASEGKYTEITWSRTDSDGNLTLTDNSTGSTIVINRGKTMINVCPTSIINEVNMNSSAFQAEQAG